MTASYPKNVELEQQIKKVYGEISTKLQQEHGDKIISSNRASTKVKGEVNTLEIFSTEGFVKGTIDSLENQCFAQGI